MKILINVREFDLTDGVRQTLEWVTSTLYTYFKKIHTSMGFWGFGV